MAAKACKKGQKRIAGQCMTKKEEISFKQLKREWYGRPESTLRYFKKKYGKKELLKIFAKVI